MYLAVLFSFLPVLVFASELHLEIRPLTRRGGKGFTLDTVYEGQSFFDGWDFWSYPDPTHGNVNYLDAQDAFSKKLAFVDGSGTIVLAVDDTTRLSSGQNRNSVRISSKKSFNGGLFIADFSAMPHGCSVWPAWWSVGPGWPQGGEIDVVEGVNTQTNNQMTLHTGPGCSLSNNSNTPFSGQILGKTCASSNQNNDGCSIRDDDGSSYGPGFNAQGGGVFAHLWDSNGITVWRFARGQIPADIQARKPNPDSWPMPSASFSGQNCDMSSHFYDHVLTLDTTLCGDWAGAAFGGMCGGSCQDAIMDPSNFVDAKWKINYIAVYQA